MNTTCCGYRLFIFCVYRQDVRCELYIKAVEWSLSQLSCPFTSVFPLQRRFFLLLVLGHVHVLNIVTLYKSLALDLMPGESHVDPEYALMYSGWFMHPAV